MEEESDSSHSSEKMRENMFQEGLYQVYMKAPRASSRLLTCVTNQEELDNVRIHRWFSSVVNTRLLISGVVQLISAVTCILTTVSHACVSYDCSVAMTTPVWSSLLYVATGCMAIYVQRKANKIKIIILLGVNFLSLLTGFSLLLAYCLASQKSVALNTKQQLAGSYVAKWSSIVLTVQCLLLSLYVLLLSWRGLWRYGPLHVPAYSRVAQDPDDTTGPLLEQVDSV